MEMILIIYTTCAMIIATTLIIWRKCSNKKKKKDNAIENPVFGVVIHPGFNCKRFSNEIQFYYWGQIFVEQNRKITKENFILIEPNIEAVFLNNLKHILNLN